MFKKIILTIILVFALLIAGCPEKLGGIGGKSQQKPKEINVYIGTNGLTAEFVKGAPPPKVFERSEFPILLKVRNIGAYSIKGEQRPPLSGLISIGREKEYIPKLTLEQNSRAGSGGTDNEAWFDIDGKTQINPKGDELIIAFNAKTGRLEPQSENKASTITATLCYPYKTTLSTTICIDPDVAGERPGKKVCTLKELSFASGQGAPIAVVKIEPSMIPDKDKIKPQFLIYVENKGKGTSVNIVGYHNTCRKSDFISKDTWNVARLRAFTTGSQGDNQLICCPNRDGQCPENAVSDGFIRFRDKKDFVRCTFRESTIKRTDDAFTSPLRVEIDYGYTQTVSANFVIQKPLRY